MLIEAKCCENDIIKEHNATLADATLIHGLRNVNLINFI